MDKLAFRRKLGPIAAAVEAELGIKARVGLIQSALESSWGASYLTVKANNLFGFTGDSWKAAGRPIYEIQTKEYEIQQFANAAQIPAGSQVVEVHVDTKDPRNNHVKAKVPVMIVRPFRSYASWDDSYRDWARLISSTPRYKKALAAARSGDVAAFAAEIQAAGYATDPNYGAKLLAVAKSIPEAAA